MSTGMKTSTGAVPAIPRVESPQPHSNTAFMTPRAAPTESRFITEATAGMSRLRNTTMSSRNARITTTATNGGQLGGEGTCEKSTWVAVTPPTRTCRPVPASAAGTDLVAEVVEQLGRSAAACGALAG